MPSVLFVGNSHTYYNEMPQMVVRLAEARGHEPGLDVKQSTASGVSLEWHWNHSETRALLSEGDWDTVVLQERSGGPLENKASMHEHARLLHRAIAEHGVQTVFYMTWARTYQPGTQSQITAAYTEIAEELGATVAPVGEAWARALNRASDLRLHAPDGRHAAPAGSYVAACVFYAVLLDATPVGLPGTVTVDGTEVVDLAPDRAALLQEAAADAVDRFAR